MQNFGKGQYENAVEQAKALLNRGVGISDIMQQTQLDKEDILKIQNKNAAKL